VRDAHLMSVSGPPMDRPADILKVWPERAPFERLRLDRCSPMLEQLATGHCQHDHRPR